MPGPHDSLDPASIEQATAAALAAAAGADSLEALKTARSTHQGDKSPLALANRGIGSVPPTRTSASPSSVSTLRRKRSWLIVRQRANSPAYSGAR